MKQAPKATKNPKTKSTGFTDEERAAMREHAQELKGQARGEKGKADGESALLAKIAEMPEPDRAMAKRIYAIIKKSAPILAPTTWYGRIGRAKGGRARRAAASSRNACSGPRACS